VVDLLAPRMAEPRDLSAVLAMVEGRLTCPADAQLCMFPLELVDNDV